MSRKIKFTKPESGQKPAVRIEFKGATLSDYYSLRRIAIEDFDVTQTELGRKIISDWLKRYRGAVKGGEERTVRQMSMALDLDNNLLAAPARKDGAK